MSNTRHSRGPYTASVGRGLEATFATIRECRAYAESYGDTADYCTIKDSKGRVCALHRRDRSGDGTRWYHAVIWHELKGYEP